MTEIENIEIVLEKIENPACRFVARHSLKSAHKALLDKNKRSRKQFLIDEIGRIMPQALKLGKENETK